MNRRAGRTLGSRLGTRDDDPLAVFVRGATVGAFVGAVIAGSTIWRRLQRRAGNGPAADRAHATAGAPAADRVRAARGSRRGPSGQSADARGPRTP